MMKLYVWRGHGVLPRYGPGVCVAMATCLEQARALVRKELEANGVRYWAKPEPWELEWEDDESRAWEEAQRAWLEREPAIYDTAAVIYLEGSE